MVKIFTDDPLIKFKDTEVAAERTKHQIDGVLSEYEVKDIYWHWDPSHKDLVTFVQFKIDEIINGVPVKVSVKVDCPTIWSRAKPKGRPPTVEKINWDVSMRAMYHFIYSHLNNAYAMQSSNTIAFLGYVQNKEGVQMKDVIIPRLRSEYQLEDLEANKV